MDQWPVVRTLMPLSQWRRAWQRRVSLEPVQRRQPKFTVEMTEIVSAKESDELASPEASVHYKAFLEDAQDLARQPSQLTQESLMAAPVQRITVYEPASERSAVDRVMQAPVGRSGRLSFGAVGGGILGALAGTIATQLSGSLVGLWLLPGLFIVGLVAGDLPKHFSGSRPRTISSSLVQSNGIRRAFECWVEAARVRRTAPDGSAEWEAAALLAADLHAMLWEAAKDIADHDLDKLLDLSRWDDPQQLDMLDAVAADLHTLSECLAAQEADTAEKLLVHTERLSGHHERLTLLSSSRREAEGDY